MKYLAIGCSVFILAFIMFLYWLAGNDYHRGPDLAFTTFFAVVFGSIPIGIYTTIRMEEQGK